MLVLKTFIFFLTSLGFWTEPSLGVPFPSYHHQPSSAKLVSPVQSTGKGTSTSLWATRCILSCNDHIRSKHRVLCYCPSLWFIQPDYYSIVYIYSGFSSAFRPLTETLHQINLWEKLTCRCLISSFFCSRKADGMPAMFSWALSSSGHRSLMNSRAFFPFRKPVRLICIILLSGCCNTHTKEAEKRPDGHWNNRRHNIGGWGGGGLRIPQMGLPTL